MQIPPQPITGSTIHCISSANFQTFILIIVYNLIILLMENLPPINEMYSCIQQQRDYDVIRKYQNTKVEGKTKKSPTKKGSYLDDTIRMSCSPGPANKSNLQCEWVKPNKQLIKYSDRKTYIDDIQSFSKKKNSPSPNLYNIELPWPEKQAKSTNVSQKTNFLDHSQYYSIRTPGPGTYLIATNIAKKVKQYHHVETKPLQERKQMSANMNTYDPIPSSYATFKKYEKMPKGKSQGIKKQEQKKDKENKSLSPGPGQYQMINSWIGKQKKLQKGCLSYLGKISKAPSANIYYN